MSKKKCKVNNCVRKHHARGFCQYHYYILFYNPNNRDKLRLNYKNHYNKHKERILLNHKKRWPKYKQTFGYKFSEYRSNANKTGKIFTLTREEFRGFWKKSCYYCNSDIDTIGLDRVDNETGYVVSNVVSCCTRCNKMKKDMDYNEFISLCRLISIKPIPFAR